MNNKITVVVSAMALVLLTGCDQHGGDEFVGTWHANALNTTDVITRSGDTFIVTCTQTIMGFQSSSRQAWTYKNGMLQSTGTFGSPVVLTYDKATDTIAIPVDNGTLQLARVKTAAQS
jgi:hypothetical protein